MYTATQFNDYRTVIYKRKTLWKAKSNAEAQIGRTDLQSDPDPEINLNVSMTGGSNIIYLTHLY